MDADGRMPFICVYQRASVVQFLWLRLAALGSLSSIVANPSLVAASPLQGIRGKSAGTRICSVPLAFLHPRPRFLGRTRLPEAPCDSAFVSHAWDYGIDSNVAQHIYLKTFKGGDRGWTISCCKGLMAVVRAPG